MSIQALPHVPPPAADVGLSTKRQRFADEGEEKEGVKPAEPAPILFDASGICADIYVVLLDGGNPRTAAEHVMQFSPDILLSLVALEKDQLMSAVRQHFLFSDYPKDQEKPIETAVSILFTTSLINSSFGKTAKSLEIDLPNLLKITEKPYLADLIKRAETLCSAQVQPEILAIQQRVGALNHMAEEITGVLNLTFYQTNFAKFENLYKYSNLFPVCAKLFPRLCQNLQIAQREQQDLVNWRAELVRQTGKLRDQASALQAPRVVKLSENREQMLDHQAVLMWDSGAELLENALKTIFIHKRRFKTFIPEDFVDAIAWASYPRDFRQFGFKYLLGELPEHFPAQFVNEIWSRYLGRDSKIVDIADLMRHIIGKLPDPVFHQLETDLKTSANKKQTVLKTLSQYFNTQFRGEITMINLRQWLRNTMS